MNYVYWYLRLTLFSSFYVFFSPFNFLFFSSPPLGLSTSSYHLLEYWLTGKGYRRFEIAPRFMALIVTFLVLYTSSHLKHYIHIGMITLGIFNNWPTCRIGLPSFMELLITLLIRYDRWYRSTFHGEIRSAYKGRIHEVSTQKCF